MERICEVDDPVVAMSLFSHCFRHSWGPRENVCMSGMVRDVTCSMYTYYVDW